MFHLPEPQNKDDVEENPLVTPNWYAAQVRNKSLVLETSEIILLPWLFLPQHNPDHPNTSINNTQYVLYVFNLYIEAAKLSMSSHKLSFLSIVMFLRLIHMMHAPFNLKAVYRSTARVNQDEFTHSSTNGNVCCFQFYIVNNNAKLLLISYDNRKNFQEWDY